MKSVLITFDQAYYERIIATLDRLNCRGFTYWEQVRGRGSKDERVEPLLEVLHNMDKQTEQLGLRAFVWNIERTV